MATTSDGVTATVMGIREHLMNYYKGTCVETLTSNNLRERNVRRDYRYHYERDAANARDERKLEIEGHTLMNMHKQPDTLILHLGTLDRSKTMRAVKEGIEKFMDRFLKGVVVETDEAGDKANWKYDRKLIMANVVTTAVRDTPVDENYEYYEGTYSNALDTTYPYSGSRDGETMNISGQTYYRVNQHWRLLRERPQVYIDGNNVTQNITSISNNFTPIFTEESMNRIMRPEDTLENRGVIMADWSESDDQ